MTGLMEERNMKAQRLSSCDGVLAIEANSKENDFKELILCNFDDNRGISDGKSSMVQICQEGINRYLDPLLK